MSEEANNENYEALAVQNIMRNEGCRTFMWGHLTSCGVFESTFNKDPYQHSYNAGNRAAGLRLESKLKEYEPYYYMKMIEENNNG